MNLVHIIYKYMISRAHHTFIISVTTSLDVAGGPLMFVREFIRRTHVIRHFREECQQQLCFQMTAGKYLVFRY